MPKKTKTGEFTVGNSVTTSVRWQKQIHAALEQLAKKKGVDISSMIRELTISQLKNSADHEDLVESLQPENPEEIQKNFFDILNKSNDVLLKTISNNNEATRKRLQLQDKLIRKLLWLVIYFNREVPDEEKKTRAGDANRRLKIFLEDFDKENS
jgi:hypothetical protein